MHDPNRRYLLIDRHRTKASGPDAGLDEVRYIVGNRAGVNDRTIGGEELCKPLLFVLGHELTPEIAIGGNSRDFVDARRQIVCVRALDRTARKQVVAEISRSEELSSELDCVVVGAIGRGARLRTDRRGYRNQRGRKEQYGAKANRRLLTA